MTVKYLTDCSDSSTPVLDIQAETIAEAMELGYVFANMFERCRSWRGPGWIRVQLQERIPQPKETA